jgi:hypothetical protein
MARAVLGPPAVMLASTLLAAGPAAAVAQSTPPASPPVSGIRTVAVTPIAPRGGVMMLPLAARRAGHGWPRTLRLTLEDGSTLSGAVAWLHRRDPEELHRTWTADPSGLAVRLARSDDDSSDPTTGAPYLLVELPEDGAGGIRLGEQVLAPIWCDPDAPYAGRPLPAADRPPLMRIATPDRPDPHSPFEHWRWVLLGDRIDRRPPTTDVFGEIGALVARHYADMWRIGLARVGELSPGVAASCRDLLTRICHDGQTSFAAWVASPDELSLLLGTLLDHTRSADSVLAEALAWADARPPVAVWPEADFGSRVRIAILNRGHDRIVARLAWKGQDDLPVAAALEPGVVSRVFVDRAPLPEPDPIGLVRRDEPARQELVVTAGTQTVSLAFGRRAVGVRAPGAMLSPFRPTLDLASIQGREPRPLTVATATSLHLRRRLGRWEAFFDCRRSPRTGAETDVEPVPDDPFASFARGRPIRAVEAVVLHIGTEDAPDVVLAVPEHGDPRVLVGAGDGALEVHRRSFADRWYARVVLPESWLHGGRAAPTLIGATRAHAGTNAVETTPTAGPPWRAAPGRIAFDLTAWE